MNRITTRLLAGALFCGLTTTATAQVSAADSVMNHVKGNRLSLGGYGEAAFSRNFYSDNGNRYTTPRLYKDDPSHGRFDIPHAVIYLGYDFGKGWSLGSEIEFEHGGTGSSIEYEADEAIEFENETEKGGEVELEQFWLQKSFGSAFNIRAGHIVVPFGLVPTPSTSPKSSMAKQVMRISPPVRCLLAFCSGVRNGCANPFCESKGANCEPNCA